LSSTQPGEQATLCLQQSASRPAGEVTDGDNSEGRAYQLEFTIDAFNALNHTNFKNFVGTITSPFFGRATAANPPRQLQLSTKFHF
jgi:hypothetical protein